MFSGELSPTHWLILGLVVLLLFGSKKLPDAARSLGRSLRILKSETGKLQEQDETSAPALSLEEQARRLEEQAAALRANAETDKQD
ncbi:Sec-independent protein translocase subunit TatA [Nonomuraea sediminis]|uniref:Sec-independent protein translocase subunit TatA n=1 Tax=Nonomuraea sediminis TaxID=2835864 RepID=UPI001BDC3F75|nr:Sec-independent protein translocase subunit TatA [Nonomuraea sediminis]